MWHLMKAKQTLHFPQIYLLNLNSFVQIHILTRTEIEIAFARKSSSINAEPVLGALMKNILIVKAEKQNPRLLIGGGR